MLRGKLGKKAMAICLAASSVVQHRKVEHRTVQQKEQRLLPRRLEQISKEKQLKSRLIYQVIH